MKKIALVMLALAIACTAVFASGAAEAATSDSGIKTAVAGKLTVATSPDFAPYEFYAIDENGKPNLAGFDMALAQYIADYLGLELDVIPMDFDGIIVEVTNRTVDLGLAGFSPSEDRKEVVSFSDIYYTSGQSFVCLAKNASMFTGLESLNSKSLKVGAQTGSIQMGLAEQYSATADIVNLVKVTDIVAEILAGTLDGGYVETAVAEAYKMNYPELTIAVAVPYDVEGSAAVVPKGNDALLAAVNEAIAQAVADGSMGKFVETANELAGGNIYEGLLEN